MNFMNAIDTNIFVYVYDYQEPAKQQRARDLVNELFIADNFVVPWQVVVEFMQVLRKWKTKARITEHEYSANLNSFLGFSEIIFPISDLIRRSEDLYSRYSLSHWDSLLVAACIEAGVTTLYSEDMSHMARYDSVQVINPFKLPSANQP